MDAHLADLVATTLRHITKSPVAAVTTPGNQNYATKAIGTPKKQKPAAQLQDPAQHIHNQQHPSPRGTAAAATVTGMSRTSKARLMNC